jgi:hypothetical protein
MKLKHVLKPNNDIYCYLMRQNTTQYFLLALLNLQRNNKLRFTRFEEEFVNVIIDTMKLSEENSNAPTGNYTFKIIHLKSSTNLNLKITQRDFKNMD